MRLLISISFLLLTLQGFCKTILVGKDQPITSLKKAIELAKDKDSIILLNGIYKEGNMVLTKSISVIGKNNPVLDGENKYEIFTISGKNILIKGITFKNSGYSAMNDYASIKLIDAGYVTIEDNTVINAYFGIHLSNTSY